MNSSKSSSRSTRHALWLLLGIEILLVLLFGWMCWTWAGWAAVGPDAFPGSPDASYLYATSRQHARIAEWLLVCCWLVAIAVVGRASRTASPDGQKRRKALEGVLVGLPVVAWVTASLGGGIG